MNLGAMVGMVIGVIFIVIPEPATTVIGLGMVAFTAYKQGWLGKGGV